MSGYKYKSLAKGSKIHICENQLLDFPIPSHFIIVSYFTLWMPDFFITIRVSNSLNPDQARHFVGPDLDPNCLQRLSADNKSVP